MKVFTKRTFFQNSFSLPVLVLLAFTFILGSCSQENMDEISSSEAAANQDFSLCGLPVDFSGLSELTADIVEADLDNAKPIAESSEDPFASLAISRHVPEEEIEGLRTFFDQEINRGLEVGIDAYLEEKAAEGLMSVNQKDMLIDFRRRFAGLVAREQPSIDRVVDFWNEQSARVQSNSTLCEQEKMILYATIKSATGFAQFYYKDNQGFQDSADERECITFWQKLSCGTAAVIAFSVTFTMVTAVSLAVQGIGEWGDVIGTVADIINFVCDSINLSADDCFNQTARLGNELIFLAYRVTYNLCCSLYNQEEVICSGIDGLQFNAIGCNYFEVITTGPDADGEAWTWLGNENFEFEEAMTTSGKNFGSAINIAQPVGATVSAVCPDLTTFTFTGEDIDLTSSINAATFSPSWAIAPPNEITASGSTTSFDIAVNSGTEDIVVLDFSSSFGANIEMTGTFTGEVTIWNSTVQEITITATITNTCTGVSESIQKTVSVN